MAVSQTATQCAWSDQLGVKRELINLSNEKRGVAVTKLFCISILLAWAEDILAVIHMHQGCQQACLLQAGAEKVLARLRMTRTDFPLLQTGNNSAASMF